jgi:hypothetical protein
MSMQFGIDVRKTKAYRAVVLFVHAVGATGVLVLAASLGRDDNGLAALAALLLGTLAILWSWRAQAARGAQGILSVDDAGRARWHDRRSGALCSVMPDRWFVAGSFVWLALADASGRRFELLMFPDTAEGDAWRRLNAWMVWISRGGGR